MKDISNNKIVYCSFCKRPNSEVGKMVQGPDEIAICDECVNVANEYIGQTVVIKDEENIAEKVKHKVEHSDFKIYNPKYIYDKISETVIGQEIAKKNISVVLYKHLLKAKFNLFNEFGVENEAILFIGPSGSGKTFLAKTIGKVIDFPFSISDATSFTEAGYVGEDVEMILSNHLDVNENTSNLLDYSIIYIDEIDKLRRSKDNVSISRDVSGEGVQQALLKIISGNKIRVDRKNKRKHPNGNYEILDTSNMLFICGGCFDGLDKIILNRLNITNGANNKLNDIPLSELYKQITYKDLIEFGIIPELLGRFSLVVAFNPLNENDIYKILTSSKNSILNKYQKIFSLDKKVLEFKDEFITDVAKLSQTERFGARMIYQVVNRLMVNLLFEVGGIDNIQKVIVEKIKNEGELQLKLIDMNGRDLFSGQCFLSYSRLDENHIDEFRKIANPYIRGNIINIWYDKDIKPGKLWREEIEKAMKDTKVAVLFVSPNFLSSDYIMNNELPFFLEQVKKQNVYLFWVLLDECLYESTEIIKFQALHDIKKPVSSYNRSQRNQFWSDVCRKIVDLN